MTKRSCSVTKILEVTHYEAHYPHCQTEMKVVSVITEPEVIDAILSHIR